MFGLVWFVFFSGLWHEYCVVFYIAFQDVNRIISRFAALRIGAAATKLTAAARQGF